MITGMDSPGFWEAVSAACKACQGLTPEQVAAIPRLADRCRSLEEQLSELASLAEMADEYRPGTDLYTTVEVSKLLLRKAP